MRIHKLQTAAFTFLLLVSVRSAVAENNYILRAPAASVPAIATRHGLQIVKPTDAHGFTVVGQNDTRTPSQVLTEVQQDSDAQGIEFENTLVVPELAAGPQLTQSTAAILDTLAGAAPVPYFGGLAWSAYVNQTAANLINMANVHGSLTTGIGIVAVVDTGVDPNHPLLQGSLVPGYDFVNGLAGTASDWVDLNSTTSAVLSQSAISSFTAVQVNQSTAAILDQSTAAILDTGLLPPAFGHGTMVAGIIHLVAPTAKIMPLKVFRADGTADLSDIVESIYYAVDNGAQVINMSFSMSTPSIALMEAISYASAHNVICVASVGNEGIETLRWPASYRSVIGVASTDNTDARSVFSNYGEELVDISAPGEGIVTAYPGGHYAVVSGTSFSAPLVSGGIALMLQVEKMLTPREASYNLSHAKQLGTDDLGAGRLDLYQALNSAK